MWCFMDKKLCDVTWFLIVNINNCYVMAESGAVLDIAPLIYATKMDLIGLILFDNASFCHFDTAVESFIVSSHILEL